jgi:hypothetical protein
MDLGEEAFEGEEVFRWLRSCGLLNFQRCVSVLDW